MRVPHLILAAGCAAALAGCGSSAHHGTGSDGFLAFARCMRSHGVTHFPDPGPGRGIQVPAGIDTSSPAFRAAQSECRHLMPGGGPPQGHASAGQLREMVTISRCMRAHGVTGFPDPTTKLPVDPQDYALAEDRGGAVLAVPRTIDVNSPAFQRAAKSCGF